ncbi:hypothetical protein M621_00740 [Serratia plymuthica S13]|uniref:Uncharacterized protein n=1 Tax=Serratia plymuthica S13 TaxID=1348660 RepID=S4YN45_SERPL|nr:hypothetical protein M621_00740 [Serratia plymuthica S13]
MSSLIIVRACYAEKKKPVNTLDRIIAQQLITMTNDQKRA